MMAPFDRVSMALTLMRQLRNVVARETEALRQMKLAPLADLQAEKTALAVAYEREVRDLRANPEIFAALDDNVRRAFAEASRELQATIGANVRALEAARHVVEGVVKTMSQSLESVQRRPSYQPGGRTADPPSAAVPVAFNREI
jgi:hypothetical protein